MAAEVSETTKSKTVSVAGEKNHMHEWIEANKQFFEPPVCLKMMYDSQLQVFFVGGPNQRKDYHIDAGEELFYQVKGDMVLKVTEKGVHRDVHIREGEVFLLPGHVHHSPQRYPNTVGMVIERQRGSAEFDGLRYFIEDGGTPTLEPLYEKYFHVVRLGDQLPPIIKAYFASEEHKTGKPTGQHLVDAPPVRTDETQTLPQPFSLRKFVEDALAQSKFGGFKKSLFEFPSQQSVVEMYFGEYKRHNICFNHGECVLWCYDGSISVEMRNATVSLKKDEMILIPKNITFTVHVDPKSVLLLHAQETKP